MPFSQNFPFFRYGFHGLPLGYSLITSLPHYKRLQGQKAHAFGALFESMFQNSCKRLGVAITRIPDGCKTLSARKIVRVKTPFDWICSFEGKTALLDTKTTLGESFAHSSISDHQIHELVHHQIAGAVAGYVIWLRKIDSIIFVPAEKLRTLSRDRGSIHVGQEKVTLIGTSKTFDPRFLFPQS